MQININKPIILKNYFRSSSSGIMNSSEYLKQILLEDAVNNGLTITDDNGNPITENDILSIVEMALDGTVHANIEDNLRKIFSKIMIYGNDKSILPFDNILLTQAGMIEKLPEPSTGIIYKIISDIIPTAKEFIAGICKPSKLFASFGYTFRQKSLGVYFLNESVFDEFKQFVDGLINILPQAGTPADTYATNTEFQQTTLGNLTECLLIDKDDTENCFRRVLMYALNEFSQTRPDTEYGLMPFSLEEFVDPDNIIFINVSKHADASMNEINKEWKMLKNALNNINPKILSQSKIKKLSTAMRSLNNLQKKAAYQSANRNKPAFKHKNYKWTKKRPTNKKYAKIIKNILYKMKSVAISENCLKEVKSNFQKPNRRDPDDFNKMGKIVSNKYYPDIHIYCDTSGSISEENYQDAITMIIQIAKKLNVDLYFSSFAHVMSGVSKVKIKGKTTKQTYNEFKKIKKVSGGTNYEQIWHYINKSKQRRKELSIIISDFEWSASSEFIKHPKNLYYMPCANMNYDWVLSEAKNFARSMLHNDSNIRKKILM